MQVSQRAPGQLHTLTDHRVALIRGMVNRGDRQMDVALWLGVSASTVNTVARNTLYRPNVTPAPVDQLPPPGPYRVFPVAEIEAARIAKAEKTRVIEHIEGLLRLMKEGLPTTS